jgi:hypothetical protein
MGWTVHSKGIIAGSAGMIEAYLPLFIKASEIR